MTIDLNQSIGWDESKLKLESNIFPMVIIVDERISVEDQSKYLNKYVQIKPNIYQYVPMKDDQPKYLIPLNNSNKIEIILIRCSDEVVNVGENGFVYLTSDGMLYFSIDYQISTIDLEEIKLGIKKQWI